MVAYRRIGGDVPLLGFEESELQWQRDGWTISTQRSRLDRVAIRSFLQTEAYWGGGMTDAMIDVALGNSLPFGLYAADGAFAGFARVVGDGALFAYLRDVFVLDMHRGKGLAKWLVDTICSHPDLAATRTWLLATADAHDLYAKCGFVAPDDPGVYMKRSGVRP
jgi:GNAT superfamily N-acetyltransferase